MLKYNLVNFRRALLIGIIVETVVANSYPLWPGLALGQIGCALLALILITYLFEVAFYSVEQK